MVRKWDNIRVQLVGGRGSNVDYDMGNRYSVKVSYATSFHYRLRALEQPFEDHKFCVFHQGIPCMSDLNGYCQWLAVI